MLHSLQLCSWRVLAMPDPDWAMVSGRDNTAFAIFNTVNIISRNKNAKEMPADVLEAFTAAAAKFGLDINAMCDIDNTICPE